MSRYQTTLSGFPARTETHQAGLALNVAFTSEKATAGALRYAAEIARGLGARLRVIVPQVVPYGRDLNDPDVDPQFTAKRALDAASSAGVEADVNVVLCRDRAEGLDNALGNDGIVMIGGGQGWHQLMGWWPFSASGLFGESSLARRLAAAGHKVLFVEGDKSL